MPPVRVHRPLRRVLVEGRSMAPELLPGDRLLLVRRPWGRPRIRPGDVVALRDPRGGERLWVKRVASIDERGGRCVVLGDAPAASTDSRHVGPVPLAAVVGRAVALYAPQQRARRIGRGGRAGGGGGRRGGAA